MKSNDKETQNNYRDNYKETQNHYKKKNKKCAVWKFCFYVGLLFLCIYVYISYISLFLSLTLSDNNQMNFKNCTTKENAVCKCNPGLYCSNDNCDHCAIVSDCLVGEGVTVKGMLPL